MIKLKLSFGKDETEKSFEIEADELLKSAVERVTKEVPLGEFKLEEVFNVVMNGHVIEKDFWEKIKLKPEDEVLITPTLRDGQIFKQVIILVVAAVASVFLSPAVGGGIYGALAVAAVTIGATLALNALIPPPEADVGALGGLSGSVESSQMYSITGQSNQMKRLGPVPKVYGTHRIFPTLAAVPYTELAVNPANGEIVQYLVAIYDFGLGTPQLSDIKIGDTPLSLESFEDFQFRLVDPNAPFPPQDNFDVPLNSSFEIYKGDRTTAQLSFNLLDGEEVIQNGDVNPDSLKQELLLDFVCPRGLFGYTGTGEIRLRKINLEIDFAPVGSSDWKPYNDLTAVDNYESIGGTDVSTFHVALIPLAPNHVNFNTYYSKTTYDDGNYYFVNTPGNVTVNAFLAGNKIIAKDPTGDNFWQVGQPVFWSGHTHIGNITAVTPVTGGSELTLDRDLGPLNLGAFVWKGTRPYNSMVITYNADASALYGVAGYSTDASLARIQNARTTATYASFRFTPKAIGQFKVRVRRVSTEGEYALQKADDVTWGALTTAFLRKPINTDKRHVFMELRIRATNQLNGNIQNLSAIASQPVDVYDEDTETWSRQITQNPAWVFVDLLTGEVNKRAVAKSRLHLPSILAWAEYCAEVPTPPPSQSYSFPRFSCNFILDYDTTLQAVLQQIGGAAQASLNVIEGKYGVLVDRLKTTPVQVFTPRNSRDFSSNRFYAPRPHAVKVKYVDPQLGWELSEVVVYDNGYDEETATEFDELTSFACTSQEQAWRFGRYMIAQNRLRQETMNILVDFENLICTRGDYVQITQDVMQVGGRPARVKEIIGGDIIIDDTLDIDPDISYGYVLRASDGFVTGTAAVTVVSGNRFTPHGQMPELGDLVVIGEIGSIVYDCIVKSISPNDDLSAQLQLVERANDIFDYESSDVLPDYDPQLSDTSRPDFSPPKAVTNLTLTANTQECAETQSGYNYYAEASWDIPPGSVYEFFEVWFDDGRGYRNVANTNAKYFKTNIDQTRLGQQHGIKIVAVAASGRKLQLKEMPELLFTPIVKATPPSDVQNFGMSITNQTLQLTWDFISDCDCARYEIRYSPDTNDIWEASVPLQIVDRNVNSVTVQARTGIYFIKAIDFAGNKSANSSEVITTIPNLFDLNVIEEFNDAPGFAGEFVQTEKLGDAVVLQVQQAGDVDTMAFFSEGFYEVIDLLDLGDIYSVRLSSYIRADGYRYGELMSNWEELQDVEHLSTADSEDWNVVAEYRATNEILAIADWVQLADVEHINEGLGQGFTEWRPIPTIGDATGRVFQFRIRLQSIAPNVTPRLFDGLIKADMPDRQDSFENLVSTASGPYQVTYDKRFHGPSPSPNVQITIDAAETGDYWVFENKNLEGFQIRFYDKTDTQVVRQFDVLAKGYGSRHTVTI